MADSSDNGFGTCPDCGSPIVKISGMRICQKKAAIAFSGELDDSLDPWEVDCTKGTWITIPEKTVGSRRKKS